jgi:radical SAM superfamily enzyme YgiQ (UPF0313 family)
VAEGGRATPLAAEGGRATDWPLVIAGGPQADNPEPMAEFLDLVVIGDGEHAMEQLLAAYKEYKHAGVPRREMIVRMARRFPWVYAPNLYEPTYHVDGTLAGMTALVDGLPPQIERCQTPDFEDAPFPVRPLLPWVEVVHDRISVEVMRGCPQRCRFCHAGYTKRPLGLRSVERILEIVEEAYWATGHKEIGLLSLSTADYPHLRELSEKVNDRFASRMVNISMPSLRVDKMLANIPWMARSVRKAGLTIAVEAANDDMRAAIRKKVTDGRLLDGVRAAYEAGWNRVKLYFMSGFPGERPEDIDGIWNISNAVANERKQLGKPPARVNASVSWLVPKPFTPLQWMAQPRIDYFHDVRRRLAALSGGRKGAVRVSTHQPERSILEGVFARGDRRLGPVIFEAWRLGARLDGWDECFDNGIWLAAYEATGIDPDFYAHRERGYDEVLPWDHIASGPKRDYLERQYDDVFTKINVARPLPVLSA